MKRILLLILILLIVSCNKIVDSSQDIYNSYLFNSIESKSDQITIKLYSPKSENVIIAHDTFAIKKVYKIIGEKQIESFDKIFENARKTQYCCCPKTNYSIAFLKDKKILDIYFVDTIQIKDSIRIFEKRWQYSFVIEKQKWRNYLSEIKN